MLLKQYFCLLIDFSLLGLTLGDMLHYQFRVILEETLQSPIHAPSGINSVEQFIVCSEVGLLAGPAAYLLVIADDVDILWDVLADILQVFAD